MDICGLEWSRAVNDKKNVFRSWRGKQRRRYTANLEFYMYILISTKLLGTLCAISLKVALYQNTVIFKIIVTLFT